MLSIIAVCRAPCACAFMWMCICACMRICMYVGVFLHLWVCLFICVRISEYIYVYACICVCTTLDYHCSTNVALALALCKSAKFSFGCSSFVFLFFSTLTPFAVTPSCFATSLWHRSEVQVERTFHTINHSVPIFALLVSSSCLTGYERIHTVGKRVRRK